MKQTDPQYKLRLSQELKDQVEEAAKQSGRSMNAEIVARLQQTFSTDQKVERVAPENALESTALRQEIEQLKELLNKQQDARVQLSVEMIEQIAQKAGEAAATRVFQVSGSSVLQMGELSVIAGKPPEQVKK